MKILTFTLSDIEATYIVGALKIVWDAPCWRDHDRTIILGLIDKMAAPLDLSVETISRLHTDRRQA